MRVSEGIGEDAPRWSAAGKLHGIESERSQDLVDLAVQICLKKGMPLASVEAKLMIDVSQSAVRKPFTYNGILRSITTSSQIFVCSRRRALVAPELFSIMGFEGCAFQDLSEHALSDLVGECFALPSIGMVLMALATALSCHWTNL